MCKKKVIEALRIYFKDGKEICRIVNVVEVSRRPLGDMSNSQIIIDNLGNTNIVAPCWDNIKIYKTEEEAKKATEIPATLQQYFPYYHPVPNYYNPYDYSTPMVTSDVIF